MQIFFTNTFGDVNEWQYTCEKPCKWSAYNSNLQMQSIKVVNDNPPPEAVINRSVGGPEGTLALLHILREQKLAENKIKKDQKIYKMAMAMKRQKDRKESTF